MQKQWKDVYLVTWALEKPLTDDQVLSARTAINGWLARWATYETQKEITDEIWAIIDSRGLGLSLESMVKDTGISINEGGGAGFGISRWGPDEEGVDNDHRV